MTMTTEALSLPRGRPFTRTDLDAKPDDGNRYELLDGALLVTPAPSRVHQRVSGRLQELLNAACPRTVEAFAAPVDVALDDLTVVQPDLVVAHVAAFADDGLPVVPVLAVEILSPSTRGLDLLLKKARYARAGFAHYWVVDPDEPSMTAWELADGEYERRGRAMGSEAFRVEVPFPLTVVPSQLVRASRG